MTTIRMHGITFSLVANPDHSMWVEVTRDIDNEVVVAGRFDGIDGDFAPAIEDWVRQRPGGGRQRDGLVKSPPLLQEPAQSCQSDAAISTPESTSPTDTTPRR